MGTFLKLLGVGAAFGIGYLIFRPKKSAASEAAGGCFDQNGVQAWAKGDSRVNSIILIRSKSDLALAPVSGEIDTIVIGDICQVYKLSTANHRFEPNDEMTQSLREFLASLVSVKGETVAGITWEASS